MNNSIDKGHVIINPRASEREILNSLQRETFDYFLSEVNPKTGLIADKTQTGSPSSIGVVGMGLSANITGVERKFPLRYDALKKILKILRFFYASLQSIEPVRPVIKVFIIIFLNWAQTKGQGNVNYQLLIPLFSLPGVYR